MSTNIIRPISIFHLCLVFSFLLFRMGDPYSGELYRLKAQQCIFESIHGNNVLFAALPAHEKERSLSRYTQLLANGQKSFTDKLWRSLNILFFELVPYERLWILCSILLSLLLLLNVAGARAALWILPLIVTVWAIANQRHGTASCLSDEQKLFPTESYLIANYSAAPLSLNWKEQQHQLSEAWQRYLIHEWSHETPEEHSELFTKQLVKGLFAFNLERSQLLPPIEAQFDPPEKLSPYLWALILGWHLLFAAIGNFSLPLANSRE